jgi:uncharacterized UBP type Zn finger protein
MSATCTHRDRIRVVSLPEHIAGCEECLAIGGRWVHLRMCMTCGKVGCCDSSPNRHASRHAAELEHPILRSAEPGEDWSWCVVDETYSLVGPESVA